MSLARRLGFVLPLVLTACSTAAPTTPPVATPGPTSAAPSSSPSASAPAASMAPVASSSVTTTRFNNQPESLSGRVERKDETIRIQSTDFRTQQLASTLELKRVAEVAPPQVLGKNVQATDVQVQGNLAFVSYDIAGPEFSGGVYILDISDPTAPRLLAEMTAADFDAYALMPDGDRLFVSGASLSEKLSSPALLQVLQLSADGTRFEADLGSVDLPSYAATDVAVHQGKVYVTSGDLKGGISLVDAKSLKPEAFFGLADARSVSANYLEGQDARIVAFRGTPGALQILDTQLQPVRSMGMADTATIPHSQSILDVQNNWALVGAGNGGGVLVDLSSGQRLAQQKPVQGITNGASLSGDLAFLANGEDGVSVARTTANGSLETLGSLVFAEDVSSNTVFYRNKVLFVANGRGGLSILTVTENQAPSACQGTPDNLLANPGFEQPEGPFNQFTFVKDLPCWQLVGSEKLAEIDPVSTWKPAEGRHSIDLNPNTAGAIAQTVKLAPGQAYQLSFALAGNINGLPTLKKVEVFWAGKSLGVQEFESRGRTVQSMGWKTITLALPAVADNMAELRFVSLTSGSSGPVLDQVKIAPLQAK